MDFSNYENQPSAGNDLSDIGSNRSLKSLDSDDSQVSHKSGNNKGLGCYNLLKVLNNFLYVVTLCLALGYFRTMKFTSMFAYYAFEVLLIVRPALILFYSMLLWCLDMRRISTTLKGKKASINNDGNLSDFNSSQRSDFGENVSYLGANNHHQNPGYEGGNMS